VKVDVDADRICRWHAQGKEIALTMGGEQIRLRAALPDGSAVLVKYDTRSTATINGSVELVRRDRTRILVRDGGEVDFSPGAAWHEGLEDTFRADCQSPYSDLADLPGVPSSAALDVEGLGGASLLHNLDISQRGGSLELQASAVASGASASALLMPMGRMEERSLDRTDGQPPPPDTLPSVSMHKSVLKRPGGGSNTSSTGGSGSGSRAPKEGLSVTSAQASGGDVVRSKPNQTAFRFDLESLTCEVVDLEHNHFFVDLGEWPVEPQLALAGEVEGLRMSAVSESPIEPRVFILSRTGTADEVVAPQELRTLEQRALYSADTSKATQDVVSQLADLGGGLSHVYLTQRAPLAMGAGVGADIFPFEVCLAPRRWHARPRVAAAAAAIAAAVPSSFLPTGQGGFEPPVPTQPGQTTAPPALPLLLEARTYTEMMPLSTDGYKALSASVGAWGAWCRDRVLSLNRFVVGDDRAEEELAIEQKVQARLKKAYSKAKKDTRAKKAAADMKKASQLSELAARQPDSPVHSVGTRGSAGRVETGDCEKDEEDTEETPDPEEREVREAFQTFQETRNNAKVVARGSLRPALLQVFNAAVPRLELEAAVKALGADALGADGASLAQFRVLYAHIRAAREVAAVSPLSTLEDKHPEAHADPPHAEIEPHVIARSHSIASSVPYWDSPDGQQASGYVPPLQPPLCQRPLDWDAPSDTAPKALLSKTGPARAQRSYADSDQLFAEHSLLQLAPALEEQLPQGAALQAARGCRK
jgi:hypothetical protein